jgi:hypothetical protein
MTSEPNKRVNSAKELEVPKLAYELAMTIFEITKGFPPEERFALTTQIRRSSRSVCLNLREAWATQRFRQLPRLATVVPANAGPMQAVAGRLSQ